MEKLSLSPIFTTGDGAFPSVEGRKVPLPAGSGPRTACPPSQSSLAQAQKNWDGTGHPAWGWRLARWDPTGTAATPSPQYSTTTTQAGVATRQIGQTLVPEFLPKYPVLILWLAIPSTGRPPGTGLWSVHLLCRSGSGEGTLPLPRHQLTPPGCLLWMPPSPTTIPLPGQSLLSASPSSQPFSSTLFRDRSSCLAMPRPLASCSIASRADSHKSPSSLWWMCTFSLQFQTKCPVSGRPPSPRTPRRLRASDPAPLPPPSLPPPLSVLTSSVSRSLAISRRAGTKRSLRAVLWRLYVCPSMMRESARAWTDEPWSIKGGWAAELRIVSWASILILPPR